LTGYGRRELKTADENIDAKPDLVAKNLLEAVIWIQKKGLKTEENFAKKPLS